MSPTATISPEDLQQLQAAARRIRRHIVRMTAAANSGHPGGSLSAVEILTALYFRVMRHDPKNPLVAGPRPLRDEQGPRDAGHLWDARRGRLLPGRRPRVVPQARRQAAGPHRDAEARRASRCRRARSAWASRSRSGRLSRAGSISATTTSSACSATATARKARPGRRRWRRDTTRLPTSRRSSTATTSRTTASPTISALEGNGNRPQRPGGWVMEDGHTANIMNLEPFDDKWRAFGWNPIHVQDGHDFAAVAGALEEAQGVQRRPDCRHLRDDQGQGRQLTWRTTRTSTARRRSPEQLEQALEGARGLMVTDREIRSHPRSPRADPRSPRRARASTSSASTRTSASRPLPSSSARSSRSASSRSASPSRT